MCGGAGATGAWEAIGAGLTHFAKERLSQLVEIQLTIKASRTLESDESEHWSRLKNKEKTLSGLAKGFEEKLQKELVGYDLNVKVSIK